MPFHTCIVLVLLRCFSGVSLIVEGPCSRAGALSGAWAGMGGSLLPLWLLKDSTRVPLSPAAANSLQSFPFTSWDFSQRQTHRQTHTYIHIPQSLFFWGFLATIWFSVLYSETPWRAISLCHLQFHWPHPQTHSNFQPSPSGLCSGRVHWQPPQLCSQPLVFEPSEAFGTCSWSPPWKAPSSWTSGQHILWFPVHLIDWPPLLFPLIFWPLRIAVPRGCLGLWSSLCLLIPSGNSSSVCFCFKFYLFLFILFFCQWRYWGVNMLSTRSNTELSPPHHSVWRLWGHPWPVTTRSYPPGTPVGSPFPCSGLRPLPTHPTWVQPTAPLTWNTLPAQQALAPTLLLTGQPRGCFWNMPAVTSPLCSPPSDHGFQSQCHSQCPWSPFGLHPLAPCPLSDPLSCPGLLPVHLLGCLHFPPSVSNVLSRESTWSPLLQVLD